MINLADIIKKYGHPQAIIEYPIQKNSKKIIFNFEETIYLDSNYNLFINNKKIQGDPLIIWQDLINKWKTKTSNQEIAALGFFSYDFKNLLYPKHKFQKKSNMKIPYFWFGKPKTILDVQDYEYNFTPQSIDLI